VQALGQEVEVDGQQMTEGERNIARTSAVGCREFKLNLGEGRDCFGLELTLHKSSRRTMARSTIHLTDYLRSTTIIVYLVLWLKGGESLFKLLSICFFLLW
jgi:hypothetical protein